MSKKKVMTDYLAIAIAEGFEEGSPEENVEAWQYIIDHKLYLCLQGFFGRTCARLIEVGICHT